MNAAAPGGDSIVAEDEVTRVKELLTPRVGCSKAINDLTILE